MFWIARLIEARGLRVWLLWRIKGPGVIGKGDVLEFPVITQEPRARMWTSVNTLASRISM